MVNITNKMILVKYGFNSIKYGILSIVCTLCVPAMLICLYDRLILAWCLEYADILGLFPMSHNTNYVNY